MAVKKEIANWGNYPVLAADVHELEFTEEIQALVRCTDTILARGNGRCYGDAALHPNIFSTLKLDKFLAFDAQQGILSCQAGVLFRDILEFIVPRGFFLPVTPGTKFITVGGAIAADIHGKNHHIAGCFSNHLLAFELMDAQGRIHHCTPESNAARFWSTVGGMGLTGIIISATFKLAPIQSAYIRQESIKTKNLEETMQLFEEAEQWTYTVAWVDCLQTGKNQGRSLFMRGEHASLGELPTHKQQQPLQFTEKKKITIPSFFPFFLLNHLSVRAFNFLFYHKQFAKKKERLMDYDSFFYPLDALHQWNRIYGKQGFTQYQFVIPKANALMGLKKIFDEIRMSKQGAFLTVLKLFGQANPLAYKSFPMEGYTLALDFKINNELIPLIAKLDELIEEYGGKIYLAKDAFSKRTLFKSNHLTNTSPKFSSVQAKRLFSTHQETLTSNS
ncbi:MAG: FAD-binding oxidoreductase [Flammeovirgaceae bacterium]